MILRPFRPPYRPTLLNSATPFCALVLILSLVPLPLGAQASSDPPPNDWELAEPTVLRLLGARRAPGPSSRRRKLHPSLRAALVIEHLNPFPNAPHFAKVQLHAHSTESHDGTLSRSEVLEEYAALFFDAVALTDHENDTSCAVSLTDPGVGGTRFLPGQERQGRQHVVQILGGPLCPDSDLSTSQTVQLVELFGGLAFAAHPLSSDHLWTEKGLYQTPWLRGIELKASDEATGAYRHLWDSLLRSDRQRWGLATDDSHRTKGITRRWVMVNVNSANPSRTEVLSALRDGHFYSVISEKPDDVETASSVGRFPHFARITASANSLSVRFHGATHIRMVTADSEVIQPDTGLPFDETQNMPVNQTFTLAGDEGFARFELSDSNGTVSFSQPVFVYGASAEDCEPLAFGTASITKGPLGWRLSDSRSTEDWILMTQDAAERVMKVLRFYDVQDVCFVGRPRPTMQYLLTATGPPAGPMPGEKCVAFSPDELQVELLATEHSWPLPTWAVKDSQRVLTTHDDNEIQARRAVEFIQRYGFTQYCTEPWFSYFRTGN